MSLFGDAELRDGLLRHVRIELVVEPCLLPHDESLELRETRALLANLLVQQLLVIADGSEALLDVVENILERLQTQCRNVVVGFVV